MMVENIDYPRLHNGAAEKPGEGCSALAEFDFAPTATNARIKAVEQRKLSTSTWKERTRMSVIGLINLMEMAKQGAKFGRAVARRQTIRAC